MTYGSPEWQPWLLGEKEGCEHIKAAYVLLFLSLLLGFDIHPDGSYDAGIQTFDVADVRWKSLKTSFPH